MATQKKAAGKAKSPNQESEAFMDKLKQFVRTRGADYLQDDNISSVGIGYKQTDGKSTGELSIQFTVGEKVVPELLEDLGTEAIPPSFMIGGVEVPTDVIQREFKVEFRVVSEAVTPARKNRIDPVVPGVSVANRNVSAGTIGCVVFDRVTGTPYILSNWHVLHGPQGRIGDEVVQPGPHDDNRVQLNHFGKLVRSHLGQAGDCAIASIEDRGFKPEILELDVKVEELGEAELGDKVIKSGRTTAVTHGIVTRVDVVVKINYGGSTGQRSIGGFEIGPDPAHPAANGEISMGGDSGSAWLFKASNGKPTKVMAGLHFAGEGQGDPNEHAVACYAKSVFEKLEITLTPPPPQPDPVPLSGRGYRPNFLGAVVNLPTLAASIRTDAFRLNNSEVIPYTHFSLAQSKSRRFAFWVAWNIDGGLIKLVSRNGIPFVIDPRIPANFQVNDDLYRNNRLDRGHIARRADLVWGTVPEAKQANRDSFFFTNIAPQMDNFNQGSLGGIWGKLEDAVFEEVDVDNLKVSVFGGPVFRSDDRIFRGVKIPREFYKIIVFVEGGVLKAKAFLLTQNLDQLELLDLNQFRVFQVAIAEIEQRTSLVFPTTLKGADTFAEQLETASEALSERKPLDSLAEIKW